MCGAIPRLPQYAFMVWCLVKEKYRDNFTFASVVAAAEAFVMQWRWNMLSKYTLTRVIIPKQPTYTWNFTAIYNYMASRVKIKYKLNNLIIFNRCTTHDSNIKDLINVLKDAKDQKK